MKIINVAGARPNFMKIAPLMEAMKSHPGIDPLLVHTGQHYDERMSKLFFEDLKIPVPDVDLEVGSGSHAVQTAEIMRRFEGVLIRHRPDLVVVVGDVNSTIACALVSVKMGIPLAHVEAGLRSFDRTMPEEINRILTDAVSDYLFTTEKSAGWNLRKEGIPDAKIHFVGNVMVDTLLKNRVKAGESNILHRLGLLEPPSGRGGERVMDYAVLTLHRPANVDERGKLENIMQALEQISGKIPVVFPVHPRTQRQILDFGLKAMLKNPDAARFEGGGKRGIYCVDPLGYLDFLHLMSHAKMVLTDSGGIQEETTVLGIPCLTLRENTERPVTVFEGTNLLVGADKEKIIKAALDILNGKNRSGNVPELWDGKAAQRIVRVLAGSPVLGRNCLK